MSWRSFFSGALFFLLEFLLAVLRVPDERWEASFGPRNFGGVKRIPDKDRHHAPSRRLGRAPCDTYPSEKQSCICRNRATPVLVLDVQVQPLTARPFSL